MAKSNANNPNQQAPQIHEHRPGKTIAQAVANASAHVKSVNKASKAK
jgi:hypothetical protein